MKAVAAAVALVALASACPGQTVDPAAGTIERFDGRVADAADCTSPENNFAGDSVVIIVDHGPADVLLVGGETENGGNVGGRLFKGVALTGESLSGSVTSRTGSGETDKIDATITAAGLSGTFSVGFGTTPAASCPFTAVRQ